jgi:hypothetical protein
MTDIVELARGERALAHCRATGVRVVLYQGKLYAGHPAPTGDPGDGVFGWAPPPSKYTAEISRHADAIRRILGDTGSARPWATEQLIGGCLLIFAPFGEQHWRRRADRPRGPGAAA